MDEPAPDPSPTGTSRFPLLLAGAAALAIVVALVVGLVLTGDDDSSDAELIEAGADPSLPEVGLPTGEPATGEPLPDVTLELWDGDEAPLTDFVGEPLVLNFFASWCAPCVAEMPDFEDVHQEVGDEVTILGVNREDSRDLAERLVERTGVTYPLATDTADELLPAVGAVVMPTTVFVSEDGTVLRVHSGSLTSEALRDAIAEEFGR